MNAKRTIPQDKRGLNELLVANLSKVEQVMKQGAATEQIDPVKAAYMAGRLDGVLDALGLERMSA